ncbi:MAG: DUF2470 domain-containing protein [Microbacterium sp.]|nr:MAG: DUF2470 domain-containing protein [Microbacterium sp.]
MSTFAPEVVTAVCAHMNDDHTEDSLRIVRAFARPEATAAVMSGLDGDAGIWTATVGGAEEEIRVGWPAAPITERAEIRREVVVLYEQACEKLGLEPSGH